MSGGLTLAIATTVAAVPVLVRVVCVLSKIVRAHFSSHIRFQLFAVAYAALGALTGQAVVDAWHGHGSTVALGFIAASALLIFTDRRSQ